MSEFDKWNKAAAKNTDKHISGAKYKIDFNFGYPRNKPKRTYQRWLGKVVESKLSGTLYKIGGFLYGYYKVSKVTEFSEHSLITDGAMVNYKYHQIRKLFKVIKTRWNS